MNDEAAFLAAIRATPNDPTDRLVFADWLDERNDARGELIRIEEEMRELPVYSDRYWQLKPRRNELRARAAPDWLEAMRYGTDCPPTFRHGVPDGWKERWRLIREFLERWEELPLGDVGGRADEIRETESHLGRTLPASVREWVAFAHDVRRSSTYHDVLRDVYQMRDLDGFPAVSLLLQCEGDYHWAVRHADLALPDPPVCGFHWDFDNRDETFVPERHNPIHPTLTAFVLGYVWGYTSGQGGGFGTEVADSASLIRQLETTFPFRSRFGGAEIFETANILVRLYPMRQGRGSSRRARSARLIVEVARPLPREAIPAFLWEHTRNGGSFHGLFIPDHGPNDPPADPAADPEIPF
jgi:uncharacterized protein (TIGR02996 family)